LEVPSKPANLEIVVDFVPRETQEAWASAVFPITSSAKLEEFGVIWDIHWKKWDAIFLISKSNYLELQSQRLSNREAEQHPP
jgi:hypothetical protein